MMRLFRKESAALLQYSDTLRETPKIEKVATLANGDEDVEGATFSTVFLAALKLAGQVHFAGKCTFSVDTDDHSCSFTASVM